MKKVLLLVVQLFFAFSILHAQVIGSRENSDLSPSNVQASSLSGGGFVGDVNVFNGTFQAQHSLGSVSTPGGLSHEVQLNYSPSYSAGEAPSICSGIPYGEGWHLNQPMITVSNAAYFPFLVEYECIKQNQISPDSSNYFTQLADTINSVPRSAREMQGDAFWFSPEINIPGVANGRAVFKYIDEDDANAAVFVMNKFEKYCEARFYGSLWVVTDDAGNQYTFSTSLVTYRAPNNQRILNYNTYNNDQTNETGNIIEKNAYGGAKNAVLNVIEPKQSFTSWYCSSISNKNLPSQTIVFEYEKFGGFNYFKEFEQPLLSAKISSELRGLLTTFTPDYTAYTDIFLTKVTSQLLNSPFEILDLGYELLPSGEIGSKLLDPRDTDTERLDSLYSYKTVYSQGGASDFTNWNRYVHGKSDSAYSWLGSEPAISNRNPYLTTSGNETSGSAYIRKAVPTSDDIEFAHSFLESPRILKDGTTLVPGDIYEIKSRITDNNASDAAMGTGTIDINIVTGTLETTLATDACTDVTAPYDSCSYTPFTIGTYSSLDNVTGSVSYPVADYEDTRGGAVFTTQNQAIKWHMAAADNDVSTSNFFVMPNVPSYYDGVNIQIGPGNSDTEYGTEPDDGIQQPMITSLPTAYNAYAHQYGDPSSLAPYEQIPNSFGIGVPWAMVEPLYIDQMGGIASNMQETDAFEFWWNNDSQKPGITWTNEPTKFDEDVRLEEVELVRYSKSPYMLKTVQLYRVNGEFTPFVDSSGLILVAQREMDYGFESDQLIENMNYRTDQTDTLIISPEYNQYVYTLNEIKNIPVAGWENNPSVSASFAETEILQTEFEYEWYGYEDGEIMVFYADSLPYTAGRRTRVMTKYIDQLGGETLIEYYPRDSKSTLKEGRYFVMDQCAQYNVERIFPRAVTQDIHPAVHFLTKLDENNNLTDTSATNPLKRWEYVYDTTQIIYQTMDYNLPAKFRNGYVKNYSKGFAKTTVYQPELKTGEKPYTNYHHLGNVHDLGDNFNPTITEYLFFGKPSYIRQYDSDGILEEETIFSYDYTHAHENGYERPNFSRDNLISPTDYTGYTNWVHSKQYEYQDYYEGQSMEYNAYVVSCVTYTGSGYSGTGGWIGTGDTLYCTTPTGVIDFYVPEIDVLDIPDADKSTSLATSTISGEAAKPYKIAPYLNNNWGNPLEKARFLEVFFFDDLSSNPDFYFDSYFVKTTQQIGRTYDDFCEKEFSSYLPDFPLTHGNPAQPFGPSFVNPYQTSTGDQLLISQINNSNNGQNVKATLISNSPLSEAVLDVFVTKIGKFKSEVIHDVLVEQPALSDNILDKVIQKSNKLQQTHTIGIFEDQPYLSDAFLSTLASTAHQHADKIIKPIYKHNEYLSDTIMHEIITASNFSQNALNEILLKQPQLSEEVLVDLASSTNNNDEFVIEAVLLQQGILTDSIFSIVLDNSNLSHASVVKIFSESSTFPTDSVLLDLFSQQVGMSHSNILTILLASPHGFGATLLTKIQQEMTATAVAAVLAAQLHTNPYGVYCENPIEEGRDYIESKVEYEYYEADYDGSTTAEGYQKLLGMEDLPRTVTNAVSGLGYDVTLTEIELKHQPSWQLFKVRNSSSNYPGAYSEEEYFYYYDQLNRVSRHYTHYDIQGGSYDFEADDAWFNDTLITSGNWPSDYSEAGSYPGHFPLTDATANAQKNNLRTIAFQKTSWTKNNVDEDPLMRSEYYFYDARWNDPIFRNTSTVHYNGPVCSDPPLGGDSPCISIKWAGSVDNVMEQVPFGYCAYLTLGGAIACPFDVDPTTCADSIVSLIGCYPVELSPEEEDSTGKAPLEAQPLDAGMYLKNVVVQIDTIPQTTDGNLWVSNRNDKSNDYIMDFYLTESEDALVRRISVPLYPYDTLTVRSIDERNRYTQVQLEHNATDIYTHYEYEVPERIWHINDNATASCPGYGNYSSVINKNIGLPTRIIVGYGRADSLTTDYTYHPNYSLNTITNPNGYDLRYEYDDYDRLAKSYENERLLSENDYEYWNRDTSLNFTERTAQNYVENTVYNSAISGGTFEGERMRAFIDPLGRNYSAVTAIDGDSIQVHSGTIHYDNWGRTVRAHKPYALSGQTAFVPTTDTTQASMLNLYETNHKARILRNAKYGINDLTSVHNVKRKYKIINKTLLGCELDLNGFETDLLINPTYTGKVYFTRVETEDEDEKRKIEYFNAIGQQVAIKQFGQNESEELITLYAYDSYGNLNLVINPEKQQTHYAYNMLGQLYKETTVDAGERKYMYNKLGLVSVEQDEHGREGEIKEPSGTDSARYYRRYTYDDYGRLLNQSKSYWKDIAFQDAQNNEGIEPLFYRDTVAGLDGSGNPDIGTGPAQEYFKYHFSNNSTYDWMATIHYVFDPAGPYDPYPDSGLVTQFMGFGPTEKSFVYGTDTIANTLGVVATANSHDRDGNIIQSTTYTYDEEERLLAEVISFNPVGLSVDTNQTVVVKISYPEYNYRGALQTINVDVHNDGYLDFQEHYVYDDWNRLREVYANYSDLKTNGNKVTDYTYDDALGLLVSSRQYLNGENCQSNLLADEITYSFDVRDRLTQMESGFLDYELFYDDNVVAAGPYGETVNYDNNHNGNINGIKANYTLDGAAVLNAGMVSGIFDLATIYGYQYDQINRLYNADAIVGDWADTLTSATYEVGDVSYNYDRIGNITNLKRGIDTTITVGDTLAVYEEWNYRYQSGTNHLSQVEGVGGTTNRNYSYDANGNLASDDFRDLNTIAYSRATYPYHISTTDEEIDYLYNSANLRLYKKVITSTDTTEEYYLKSGSGRDIGIYDIKTNEWEWYVQGTNRVAKISPDGGQQPDSISYNGYPIGSHLVASFYQYDHLGNTRVVYTPSERVVDDSTCTVEYTLEYVGDYYPYGKTLREFVNGDREKFLTTQHERDVETGLDYRGARFYDGDIARFLSLDPLAMDYPSLSDYSYVAGNPIRFIDPTGMAVEDYYVVDSKGNVKLEKKTDHDFDLLYRRDENGDYIKGSAIKIRDKSLLSGLSEFSGESNSDYLGNLYFAYYGVSNSKTETMKLFKYLADNTDVEWSVAGYDVDGEKSFYLGTYHSETRAPGHSQKLMDEQNLTFAIHSHPDPIEGTKGASGYNGNTYSGDMLLIKNRTERFEKWGLKPPTHYVYHKHSQNLYQYTVHDPDIFIKKITSYKDLMFIK